MSIRSIIMVMVAIVGLGMTTSGASAGSKMASVSPLGFKLFCLKNPNECKGSSKSSAAYTTALMRTLKSVNLQVNRSIKPKRDAKGTDRWTIGSAQGDCEEYVLAKRSKLIRAGVPAGALRIATARTRKGEGHAVLIVKTSRGDLVLDNLTNAIKSKSASGLRFVSISGANPHRWASRG